MKYLYWLILCCLISNWAKAQEAEIALSVESHETMGRPGQLTLTALLVATSTGQATYNLHLTPSAGFALQSHWVGRNYVTVNQAVQQGDTVRASLTVQYNPDKVSYYLENLQLQAILPDGTVAAQGKAFVYFTPYNTVEVWSSRQLDQLNRIWEEPDYTWTPPKVTVDSNEIPVCDLTDKELGDESILKKYKSVRGLAYAVPMRDDGTDTDNEDTDQARGSHNWNGTITGHVTIQGLNAVTGIRIEVWDYDGISFDDFLSSGHTNDNGDFAIPINHSQNGEGNNLELYLLLEATTAGGYIRVIKRIGITRNSTISRSNPLDWHYTNQSGINFGIVSTSFNQVKPHLLHYAYQCRRFLDQNGMGSVLPRSSSQPLEIMRPPVTSNFFGPGGFRNPLAVIVATKFPLGLPAALLLLSNEDCLYVEEDEEDEETIYHEFGHYLMWHMQGRSWANPLEASFASHSRTRNAANPKIAWTEGWAHGFARIMDAYTMRYDNERALDDLGFNFERRTYPNGELPERRTDPVRRNGVENREHILTNGYISEQNIATLLYDLWDGQNNLLRQADQPAGAPNPVTDADFNDQLAPLGGPVQPRDLVSLSFFNLTAPIRTHGGGGLFSNQVTAAHSAVPSVSA